jgi:hypothetical protein
MTLLTVGINFSFCWKRLTFTEPETYPALLTGDANTT